MLLLQIFQPNINQIFKFFNTMFRILQLSDVKFTVITRKCNHFKYIHFRFTKLDLSERLSIVM